MAAIATQMRHFGMVSVMAQKRAEENLVPQEGYKALVCVFLTGGNDSNNMVVPKHAEGYAQYTAARGGAFGLAIPQANLLSIAPPAMGGLEFGLHPNLTDLHALWGQGKLAVVTNVGTLVQPITRAQYQSGAPRPLQLFSHSDQVDQFRTAISSYRATTGWGGRVADRTGTLNPGAAISMVTSINGANLFNIGNTTAPLIVAPAPTPLNQVLVLNGFTDADANSRKTAMENIRTADLSYSMIQSASVLTQQAYNVSQQLSQNPVLTVTFPNTTLGNQLAQVAKIMKFRTQLNMSRQIFYVSVGTFDTHSGQLTGQGNLLTQVNQALKAFYDETVAQGIAADVTTFTMSDFNRTFNPAGGGANVGTDHAWGGHHLVMGGSVLGGDFYGRPTANGSIFPTLVNNGPDDAESRGRFIPSVPVEAYAATLARWFGLSAQDVPLVFPNINNFPFQTLNFLPF
jgi:uncharacterized protein (DUF1501 family)